VRHIDDLVLEGEDQALDGLTAVDQLGDISADEKVTRVQQHSLEKQEHIVHLKRLEQGSHRVRVDVGKLLFARLSELDSFVI